METETGILLFLGTAAVLCCVGSFAAWGWREGLRQLIVGVVFGTTLPLIAAEAHESLILQFDCTLAGVPVVLPLFWIVAFHAASLISFGLSRRRHAPWVGPVASAIVVMILGTLWDRALVAQGLVRFTSTHLSVWPFGLPLFLLVGHGVIGFVHESISRRMRQAEEPGFWPTSVFLSLLLLSLFSLPLVHFPHGFFNALGDHLAPLFHRSAYLAAMGFYAAALTLGALFLIVRASWGNPSARPSTW